MTGSRDVGPGVSDAGAAAFLLTDVEASSEHWESDPAAMSTALADLERIIDDAATSFRGRVINHRGEGDSSFVVFDDPAAAVEAATALQAALLGHSWPTGKPVRVRIGLHAGQAQMYGGDHFGPVVTVAARLRDAAHGGQVLVSGAVRDAIPESRAETALTDLGRLRLRGLSRSEQVFQLRVPGGPETFPPPRMLEGTPNNLPATLTRFIGREHEQQRLEQELRHARLVTLVGPGGIGKTRLAVEVAKAALEAFPDGVWLVPLAPTSDPEKVVDAVARVLAIRESSPSLVDAVVERLGRDVSLLLLDNCEHVLEASAQLAQVLLNRCPNLRVLATSREALAVAGEVVRNVPPLDLPAPEDPAAREAAAPQLFLDRAAAVVRDFGADDAVVADVVQICRRLDGIPLAIELAAARVNVMPLRVIAERLGDRRVLTSQQTATEQRQRTLWDAIDWSVGLLPDTDRMAFIRLGVFAGGCHLDAVEAVVDRAPLQPGDAVEALSRLVSRSLVTVDGRGLEPRFGMLQTIRDYARGELLAGPDHDAVARAHAEWFAGIAASAETRVMGPAQTEWLTRLSEEHANFAAALEWALDNDAELALRLTGSLVLYWYVRGHFLEGVGWLEQALARAGDDADAGLRAKALWGLGYIASFLGDVARAMPALQESLQIAAASDDDVGVARATSVLAGFTGFQDPAAAIPMLDDAEARAKRAGQQWLVADVLAMRGWTRFFQSQLEASRLAFDECLISSRAAGNQQGIRVALLGRNWANVRLGEIHGSDEDLREALALARQLDDPYWTAGALMVRADLQLLRGLYEDAWVDLAESEALARRVGSPIALGPLFGTGARLMLCLGRPEEARRYVEEALGISRAVGMPFLVPVLLRTLARIDEQAGTVSQAGARLEEARDSALAIGADIDVARVDVDLARLALHAGDTSSAQAAAERALAHYVTRSVPLDAADCLDVVAALFADSDSDAAVVMIAAVDDYRERSGVVPWPMDRPLVEATRAAVSAVGRRTPPARSPGPAAGMSQALRTAAELLRN